MNLNVIQKNYEEITTHDIIVLENAQLLQKYIVDAETGQRGFIITGDEQFLEPYYLGIDGFHSLIIIQKELVYTENDQEQLDRLNRIESLF